MRRFFYFLAFFLGLASLFLGFMVFTTDQTKVFSGLCIGVGSVLAVLGIGNLIYSFVVSQEKAEETKLLKKIEVNDERNKTIMEKTASMTSRIMTYVISAFIVIISILGADRLIISMAIFILIIKGVSFIVFSNYYAKKM